MYALQYAVYRVAILYCLLYICDMYFLTNNCIQAGMVTLQSGLCYNNYKFSNTGYGFANSQLFKTRRVCNALNMKCSFASSVSNTYRYNGSIRIDRITTAVAMCSGKCFTIWHPSYHTTMQHKYTV